MPSPQERYSGMLSKQGVEVTYKRITGQTINATTLVKSNTISTSTIKGHFRKFSSKDISGLVREGDRQFRIAASDITFEPQENDIVTTDEGDYKVVKVDVRTANGSNCLYICQLRGRGE